MIDKSEQADAQYTILGSLQWYWRLLKALFYMHPWLVIIWFCYSQAVDGAATPQWWIEFLQIILQIIGK